MKTCYDTFKSLKKKYLTESSILKYHNQEKLYTLFTEASKYALACVLNQTYIHTINGKEKAILLPIIYMSGVVLEAVNLTGLPLLWRHMLITCSSKSYYSIQMLLISFLGVFISLYEDSRKRMP